MIDRIIEFSLKNRFIIIALYLFLAGWGLWALFHTPIDAIPDLSENQVIVFTDWMGRSPQEVEDQVTYPLTVNLQGLAGVKVVRSQSAFGFSMINVIFEDNVDLYFARTRILERLTLVSGTMPEGVKPTLGPDATGVGQIFWYTIESDKHSLIELRSIQDWFVRYQLNSVPGVAEVGSVGGWVQQYQIDVDPNKLRNYDLPLSDLVMAVGRSNNNVGGNVIEANGTWTVVRGIGLIESPDDIANIVIRTRQGTPLFIKNVATVKIGGAFRQGALDKNGTETVGGVVVARYGVDTLDVINAVKHKIDELKTGLPEGVRIVPFYDRTELINRATGTLKKALIEEILLVTLAHIIFLFHFRSILIVTLPLPLAVLISFLLMHYFGISSNLMSLSGIAIAIGVLVDAGIVVTENCFRQLEKRGVDPKDRRLVWETVMDATKLVGRPVFFSMTIIILAFIPVFALTGQEGKLFHPLAFTKTFAMAGSTLIAVTLVPVLCTLLLGGKFHREEDNRVMRILQWIYQPILRWALKNRALTLLGAGFLFSIALLLATSSTWLPQARRANLPLIGNLLDRMHFIGAEFMPPLDEGDLMFMPVTDTSVSLPQALEITRRQNVIIKSFPEVEWAVGKPGRAETSTDPSPINMIETVIHLKPPDQWRRGMTSEKLVQELDRAVSMPGVTNIWTQPIRNRIEMLATGIRTEVGLKIFGSDLKKLEEFAQICARELISIRGASDVYPEQIAGAPYLNIRINREAAARYNLSVGAIQEVIETAIGETNLTVTIEGRKRFPVRVRYAPQYRDDPRQIGNVLVGEQQIPLSQVADIRTESGPSMISSENGLLRATVLLNVRGRDVGGFVEEARLAIKDKVKLPPGYFFQWSGQYENQIRAKERLQVVLPLVLVIIFILLYLTYNSFLEAAHVLLAVPFALTGGVFMVYALGYNFSVAVWVGFIALFGTAVQTGVVMVIYLEEAVDRKRQAIKADGGSFTRSDLLAAVTEGALLRLRPKVMTVSTVIAGLLPIMWSTQAGSEVMRPLAAPVLGGMVSSLLHVLVVTPVIFFWLQERRLRKEAREATK
ncbi:MAG: efflux RND transporter permease subunit [Acidobacteria bacterium]|nr:efflux RND transporter permease subunit [Acidobacteriota bacterium]